MPGATTSHDLRPVTLIRIRGIVQGVGFRPAVWGVAHALGLDGDVCNDGDGVLVRLASPGMAGRFIERLRQAVPPLARIDSIESLDEWSELHFNGFNIIESRHGAVTTGVSPDAATCPACLAEIRDPANRRHRYPFTNCTHCGPRLSIIRGIPYDREQTSMAAFRMCRRCRQEYDSPADRRFHAQPNACPDCGPQAWLETADGARIAASDPLPAAAAMLRDGSILAIKGIGGFHLAADATNPAAVERLRQRKRRFAKPFALMARETAIIRHYCHVDGNEAGLLESPAAPILLLRRRADASALPDAIAPGQVMLGFMLPYSPLHHLLLGEFDSPLVMTSGNLSDEPQCIRNDDARQRLGAIADAFLLHDREIVNRIDDSVTRIIDSQPRILRRARGYAPASLPLPAGFEKAPDILALGGELKNSFCLLRNGEAILSQHMGDLEDASTWDDYLGNLDLYARLFAHEAETIAIDAHPDYRSSAHGREMAARLGLRLHEIHHHHAHIASCLAENGHGLSDGPVIGIALDGLGYGPDGTIWGGEFLVADYVEAGRAGHFHPAPMPGGTMAILEPWRNCFAQLLQLGDWKMLLETYADLELAGFLRSKPLETLAAMIDRGINSPPSSSCGRLFDAVAAAAGVCRERIHYEGQAAIELEAVVDTRQLASIDGYPFLVEDAQSLQIDPSPMWLELLGDLRQQRGAAIISARFHKGLADVICRVAAMLARKRGIATIALSGGVFQNATLLALVERQLARQGIGVLTHRGVPANDGGLALGQAVIAAARTINSEVNH
ncbi:MAG: carbamoyltransferase HypF [Gammaproteobacteria bacterium]